MPAQRINFLKRKPFSCSRHNLLGLPQVFFVDEVNNDPISKFKSPVKSLWTPENTFDGSVRVLPLIQTQNTQIVFKTTSTKITFSHPFTETLCSNSKLKINWHSQMQTKHSFESAQSNYKCSYGGISSASKYFY